VLPTNAQQIEALGNIYKGTRRIASQVKTRR
jgi:hypothetical protein